MKRFALEAVRPSLEVDVKSVIHEHAMALTIDICARRSRKLIDADMESSVGNDGTEGPGQVEEVNA
jgi:hypothetical protein